MKNLFKLFSILALSLIFLVSCSSIKSTMKSVASVVKSPTKYNNVTVTFVTTQGSSDLIIFCRTFKNTCKRFHCRFYRTTTY